MARRLVEQTPVEFFRGALTKALQHQKVPTSAFAEFYLVNLLAGSVRSADVKGDEPGASDLPLAMLYGQALEAHPAERARLLRALGDTALFVSGFFAESLARRHMNVKYYRTLGGFAYGRLSRRDELLGFGPEVYAELATHFHEFADVLTQVADQVQANGTNSIPALYERWLETGSLAAAERLLELGVAPVRPVRNTMQ